MKNFFFLFFASGFFLLTNNSCKKDSFISSSDAILRISADSIKFDTVFTSVGSVTQSFKIVNENNQQIRLSTVKLMGGSASAFKININGVAATQLNNIEIAANDSIYIFVSVTVNPTAANLPFVISDSISVQFNNNQRWVQLQAYGQNAHFFSNSSILTNISWPNDLPYVILGSLHIAENASLTISPGVKIFAHADAPIIVDGTIVVNGTPGNKVIFSGDRLDEPYKNFPASWPGIYFRSTSKNNQFQFAEIKNAYQAVVVLEPSPNANPKLTIQQCIIDNAYNAGLYCSNSSVMANNILLSNCSNNIYIELGGNYTFTHCTAATYSNNYMAHKTSVVSVANYTAGNPAINNLQANFTNCIFWGENGFVDNEILVNKQGTVPFSVSFNNCLYKVLNDPANASFIASIKNIDPLFDSIDISNRYYDFHQNNNAAAPGINKGKAVALSIDLDGKTRNVGLPDMGCYEKQ